MLLYQMLLCQIFHGIQEASGVWPNAIKLFHTVFVSDIMLIIMITKYPANTKKYIHTSIYIYIYVYTEIEWHDFVFSYIVLKSLVCVKCYFYFKNYSVIRLKRGLKVVVVGFYYIIIIHLGNSCYKIRKKLPNLQLIMWPVLCVLFVIKYGVRVQFIFGMMGVYSRCAEYSKTIYYDMLWYIINIFVMKVQFNKYINISDI